MLDLIDRLIIIEDKVQDIYTKIATANVKEPVLKSVARVLIKEEQKHIRYYRDLQKSIKDPVETEIDFFSYDKISSLTHQFKERLMDIEPENTQQLLKFALNLEEENRALLIDIQGRFLSNQEEVKSKVYILLTNIIKEEEKHINNLKRFIKG